MVETPATKSAGGGEVTHDFLVRHVTVRAPTCDISGSYINLIIDSQALDEDLFWSILN